MLFGGFDNNTRLGDTWEWDGTTWELRAAVPSPPSRNGHAMAYDAARQRAVVFGGYGGGINGLRDMWEWDGTTWTQRTSPTSPSSRSGHALAYDPATQGVVLFGGQDDSLRFLSDLWEWNGTTWAQRISFASTPPERRDPGLAYDEARRRIVIFGGTGPRGVQGVFADTWEFLR